MQFELFSDKKIHMEKIPQKLEQRIVLKLANS